MSQSPFPHSQYHQQQHHYLHCNQHSQYHHQQHHHHCLHCNQHSLYHQKQHHHHCLHFNHRHYQDWNHYQYDPFSCQHEDCSSASRVAGGQESENWRTCGTLGCRFPLVKHMTRSSISSASKCCCTFRCEGQRQNDQKWKHFRDDIGSLNDRHLGSDQISLIGLFASYMFLRDRRHHHQVIIKYLSPWLLIMITSVPCVFARESSLVEPWSSNCRGRQIFPCRGSRGQVGLFLWLFGELSE